MKTVADLWPGDVIVARAPGQCFGYPTRIVSIESKVGCDAVDRAWITFNRTGDDAFTVVVPWDTPLEED